MPAPVLAKSIAPNNWLSVGTNGGNLTGASGQYNQLAANHTNVTLTGANLDDTYIAYDWATKIVEKAGGGTDTVVTWGNEYTLGANLENLTLMGGANSNATGNSGNNLITGNDGNNVITTGGGNDVLVGSKGSDDYVISKAAGTTTWITGFKTGSDSVDLSGYGISGFSGLQARMSQVGSDVRIDLGNGQQLMLESKTIGALTSSNFVVEPGSSAPTNPPAQPTEPPATNPPPAEPNNPPAASPNPPTSGGPVANPADVSGLNDLKLTFSDEFNTLDLYTTWQPNDAWGNRTLSGNGEQQWYIDPEYQGLGINPFSVDDGILTITAAKTDPSVQSQIWGYQYTSGMLTSYESFSQQYGYFEIRAQVTDEQGMWPAFWMLSTEKTWPPELDIMEYVGKDPNYIHQTMHTSAATNSGKSTWSDVNPSEGFHTYGMDWTADKITFYMDGQVTHQVNTPADMHTPMYLLVNLAVGGNWPGSPDGSTDWSDTNYKIDYIRAYEHTGEANPTTPPPAPSNPQPPVVENPPPAAENPPPVAENPPPATPDPEPTPDPVPTPDPTPNNSGFAAVLSNEMDATNLASSFEIDPTGANKSQTFNAGQMDINGIDNWATVTASHDGNNNLTLTNNGIWNAVKNARVESSESGGVTINNFVATDITLGNGADKVNVTGAKRGNISTGGGNDQISVSATSNAYTENWMNINAGAGDDTIGFFGADNTNVAVNAGAGNDRISIATSGESVVTGGSGADIFEFIRSAHATITDFNASEDKIVIKGGSSGNTQVKAGNGFTTVDMGNGSSVTLAGVTVPQNQINITYA